MGKQKKILVLGASGAMGRYLMPILAEMGYQADGLCLPGSSCKAESPDVHYYEGNAKDPEFSDSFLKKGYDGIIDFLIYPTAELVTTLPRLINSTDHYIYLSSYRIYDNKEIPVKETSPRLLDSSEDTVLRNSDDYCIYKARGENIIRAMFPKKNWSIIRPSITYSYMRYQLTTLEAPYTVARALRKKKVILPVQAKDIQGTMTWGGDSARMIANLLFKDKALGEAFSITTAEHHTWGEIADYYHEICGMESVWVDEEDFLELIQPNPNRRIFNRWQLDYDRLFDRVMDNSKVLSVTGLKQENFKKLFDGLQYEVGRCPKDFYPENPMQTRMDDYLKKHNL